VSSPHGLLYSREDAHSQSSGIPLAFRKALRVAKYLCYVLQSSWCSASSEAETSARIYLQRWTAMALLSHNQPRRTPPHPPPINPDTRSQTGRVRAGICCWWLNLRDPQSSWESFTDFTFAEWVKFINSPHCANNTLFF